MEIFLEILNTYGLPVALSLVFILWFKRSVDKQVNFLTNQLEKESNKDTIIKENNLEIKKINKDLTSIYRKLIEVEKLLKNIILGNKN